MFIGHFGAGLAAKKLDTKPSLGTLFFASQFIDLLWPILLLFGLERVNVDPGNTVVTPLDFVHYPISHSFFSVLIWAILFAGIYFIIRKNIKSALIMCALVLSHWILDLLTHRPDLPLFPWTEIRVGFGLWNSLIATIIIEGSIFVAGAYLYMKTTKAENKKGSIGLWSLLVFLTLIYISNLFGPPPPSQQPIAILGMFQWLLVIWAYWIDGNRKVLV